MKVGSELAPVVVQVSVARDVAETFGFFTKEFGSWWPVERHSIGESKVAEVRFESGVGGRILERWADGTEYSWGEVLVWEPPSRVVFTWHPTENPVAMTEVEVTFESETGGTRVTLEHRNWDALGDIGAEARGQYSSGWPGVMERFAGSAA